MAFLIRATDHNSPIQYTLMEFVTCNIDDLTTLNTHIIIVGYGILKGISL